jgi:isoprenylcysteine carboxyl methyltransferase (ICMT) family protein YpbQ
MGEPPDPTADQLLCPSHEKLCKNGICSGMSRLVREEERKKREVERGGVEVGEVGFVRLLTFHFVFGFSLAFRRFRFLRSLFLLSFLSLLIFGFSCLLLFVVPLKTAYIPIGPRSRVN